jgi:hypothetical protein
MKQYEAVIKIMKENRGYATLNYLYEKSLKVPGVVWKTKTPFASIRRIVQDERFFFKIKPGLWALKTYKNKLPCEIFSLIEENKDVKKEGEFTHSYFQGMIAEIGVMKGFKTYVPPQDQNKKFLNKTLGETVNLNDIFNFTYENLIQKVRSIDVFWFNERKFPSYVFEVEHTTNFINSLQKFLELQDFNVNMYIVSSALRKNEFLTKIDLMSFKSIKDIVKFIDYEYISQWHSKVFELYLVENKI